MRRTETNVTIHKPIGRAQIWRWRQMARLRYYGATAGLFIARLWCGFLRFKHFGWVAVAIFIS